MPQGLRTLAIAAVVALFPAVTMSAAAGRFAHDDEQTAQGPACPSGPAAVLPRRKNGSQ